MSRPVENAIRALSKAELVLLWEKKKAGGKSDPVPVPSPKKEPEVLASPPRPVRTQEREADVDLKLEGDRPASSDLSSSPGRPRSASFGQRTRSALRRSLSGLTSKQPNSPQQYLRQTNILKKNQRGKWKKRYIGMDQANLFVLKSEFSKESKLKDNEPEFEITSPSHPKPFIFKAPDDMVFIEWVLAIRQIINGAMDKRLAPDSGPTQTAEQRAVSDLLLVPGNSECADCGAPDPDWASTNLGVFICLLCSGVHRSLGLIELSTHVSKVRSVRLDKWSVEHMPTLESLGNIRANANFEARAPLYLKPAAQCPDDQREEWIRRKYAFLEWVDPEFTATDIYRRMLAEGFSPRLRPLGQFNPDSLKKMFLQLLSEDYQFRAEVAAVFDPRHSSSIRGSPSRKHPTLNDSPPSLRGQGSSQFD